MNSTEPRRAVCPRCDLPANTCLCALVTTVDNPIEVLLLQHPREAHEAKGSARLLRLCLANCKVMVGEVFEPEVLRAALSERSVLLYPDLEALADQGGAHAGGAPDQLVVIDATWRKSVRMVMVNPWLRRLPRLALDGELNSMYGALRKARLTSQLSTLEATCHALGALTAKPSIYAPVLRSFEQFVQSVGERARRRSTIIEPDSPVR